MKRLVVAAGLAGLVLVAGLAGGYIYFFSGLRTTPKPLALSTATPQASASPAAAGSSAGLAGTWTVGSGSQAGYRVSEQFAGQTSSHEAVARTTSVSGGLTVQQSSNGFQATAIKFTAQLANLQSVDQVAGFNVGQRDRIVFQTLAVSQFGEATFQGQSVDLPAAVGDGSAQTVTIPGQLTIHGVTRQVQVKADIKVTGSQAQAVGSTSFNMTDFGINPPQVPITTVQPGVTLEFQLVLVKA